jgi:hypothetical protein
MVILNRSNGYPTYHGVSDVGCDYRVTIDVICWPVCLVCLANDNPGIRFHPRRRT